MEKSEDQEKKNQPINPFLVNNPIEVVSKSRSQKSVNMDDIPTQGEIKGSVKVTEMTSSFLIDRVTPAKLYMKAEFFEQYVELSVAGMKLLHAILYRLPVKKDIIDINISEYAQLMRCSIRTVYSGIYDLTDRGFIVKRKGTEYWINPHRIFKGDRTSAFYPDFVKVEKRLRRTNR